MSNWTIDEVTAIESSGGNANDEQIFLASYSPHVYPRPDSTQRDKLREFIRIKYIEGRWMRDGRGAVSEPEPVLAVKKEKKVQPPVADMQDLFFTSPDITDTIIHPKVPQFQDGDGIERIIEELFSKISINSNKLKYLEIIQNKLSKLTSNPFDQIPPQSVSAPPVNNNPFDFFQ